MWRERRQKQQQQQLNPPPPPPPPYDDTKNNINTPTDRLRTRTTRIYCRDQTTRTDNMKDTDVRALITGPVVVCRRIRRSFPDGRIIFIFSPPPRGCVFEIRNPARQTDFEYTPGGAPMNTGVVPTDRELGRLIARGLCT